MTAGQVEAARLPIMLGELRLPTVNRLWPEFAERADKEGWPAARFLATLVEHELAERVTRRIERRRLESRLPPEKTLAITASVKVGVAPQSTAKDVNLE